jgi:hypothetical protein
VLFLSDMPSVQRLPRQERLRFLMPYYVPLLKRREYWLLFVVGFFGMAGAIGAFIYWIPWSMMLQLSLPLLLVIGAWLTVVKHLRLKLLNRIVLDDNPHLCRKCGYDLTSNTSGVCPECGTAIKRKLEPTA